MKRFKVNIHLKEWTCGDGCCSERQADIEIFDDNNFIIDDTVYSTYDFDLDYNSEEQVLQELNERYNLELTLENTTFI